MREVVYILFGCAFTVATAAAFGALLFRGLGIALRKREHTLLAFVCGSAVLSLLVFLLCAVGQARKGVFLWTGLAALIAWYLRARNVPPPAFLPKLSVQAAAFFTVLFSVFGVLYFFNAMAPEVSPDGAVYHLGLVSRYLKWHGFHRVTTDLYVNISQGLEMLFLFAFAFGRHSAAAMVHCAFLFTLPLLMLCYGRRFGVARAAICGALLFFMSPVVGIDGISAYNDVGLATVAFALFYFLQIWREDQNSKLLIPIGLLAGFAFAIKYTGFLAGPYALGFVAWHAPRQRMRRLLTVAGCAAILISPWVIKNVIWFGNPASPFLNSIFPNPYIHVSFEREYSHFFRTYNMPSLWPVPWMATVTGALGGGVGPVFLLAPIALLSLRKRMGRSVLLAALVFGVPYAANIGTRFLIPALPFLGFAMGLALDEIAAGISLLITGRASLRLMRRTRSSTNARITGEPRPFTMNHTLEGSAVAIGLVLIVHALLSWPKLIDLGISGDGGWQLTTLPARAALRIVPEERFLNEHLPHYGMARLIDRVVPEGGHVFAFNPVAEAYTTRDIIVYYQSAMGESIKDAILVPQLTDFMPTARFDFQFPPRPLQGVRVIQTAGGAVPDIWSISELRLFNGERELPRDGSWRLTAKPYPWDVQLAFDNNPVTRWRSWESMRPGMFIQADFTRPLLVSRVRVECAHDQYQVRLRLERRDDSGKWISLAGAPAGSDVSPKPGWRRAATDAIKARGVGFILVEDSHGQAREFQVNPALWGVTVAGQWNGSTLYRIE